MRHIIALFGEAEKGAFKTAHIVRELPQLVERFGNPPQESEGLFFAVQAILFEREVIFFRVAEEGFSKIDYFSGFKILKETKTRVHALCLPRVGDAEIIDETKAICRIHKSFLITSQKDLYDYLTDGSSFWDP